MESMGEHFHPLPQEALEYLAAQGDKTLSNEEFEASKGDQDAAFYALLAQYLSKSAKTQEGLGGLGTTHTMHPEERLPKDPLSKEFAEIFLDPNQTLGANEFAQAVEGLGVEGSNYETKPSLDLETKEFKVIETAQELQDVRKAKGKLLLFVEGEQGRKYPIAIELSSAKEKLGMTEKQVKAAFKKGFLVSLPGEFPKPAYGIQRYETTFFQALQGKSQGKERLQFVWGDKNPTVLGKGSFGTVHEIQEIASQRFGKKVSVYTKAEKQLNESDETESAIVKNKRRESNEREIALSEKARGMKYVTSGHAATGKDGTKSLVMEKGEPGHTYLENYAQENSKAPLKVLHEAKRLMKQNVKGCLELEKKGIYQTDFKLENTLLFKDKHGEFVSKIGDLGGSYVRGGDGTFVSYTQKNSIPDSAMDFIFALGDGEPQPVIEAAANKMIVDQIAFSYLEKVVGPFIEEGFLDDSRQVSKVMCLEGIQQFRQDNEDDLKMDPKAAAFIDLLEKCFQGDITTFKQLDQALKKL